VISLAKADYRAPVISLAKLRPLLLMPDSPDNAFTDDQLAELAALADGSLPQSRRAVVEARVAASPRLQALLAEQRRAVSAVRDRTEAAPLSLRTRVEGLRRPKPAPRRRLGIAAALTGAAATA